MSKLTAQEMIYKHMINVVSENNSRITDFIAEYEDQEDYEAIWDDVDDQFDEAYEVKYETRYGTEEPNLEPKTYSRHYEVEVRAIKVEDVWVAWDFYYGGGKHGEPEAFDWISNARIVECEEKVVTKVEYTFKEIL